MSHLDQDQNEVMKHKSYFETNHTVRYIFTVSNRVELRLTEAIKMERPVHIVNRTVTVNRHHLIGRTA